MTRNDFVIETAGKVMAALAGGDNLVNVYENRAEMAACARLCAEDLAHDLYINGYTFDRERDDCRMTKGGKE